MFGWLDKLLHPKRTVQFPDGSLPRPRVPLMGVDPKGNYKRVDVDDTGAAKLVDMNIGDTSAFSFASKGKEVARIEHNDPYRITFFQEIEGEQKEVGWIDFKDGKARFSGNLDESAEVLFDLVKTMADKYLHDKVRKINKLEEMIRGDLEK